MKALYYSFEYYCNYGARTHARSFFNALLQHPKVTAAVVFPITPFFLNDNKRNLTDNVNLANCGVGKGRKLIFSMKNLGKIWRLFVPPGIRTHIRLFYPDARIYRLLYLTIRNEKPDILILRIGSRFRFLERLRNDFPELKMCIEFNSTVFDESLSGISFEQWWRKEEANQYGFAETISVVSEYLRQYLLSLSPGLGNRIFVNPNGVDPEMFKPLGNDVKMQNRRKINIPDDAVVFGYVGGMESFRRLPEVVYQIAALRRQGMDKLFLAIIGTGKDSEKVSYAVKECLGDLSGWVYQCDRWIEHEHIPLLMSTFDIGIFPYSNIYGSPQKILEYMACALPIIGPNVPAVTEQFDEIYIPHLVNQDGSNFNEIFRYVYDNLRICKAEATQYRELVQNQFTWDANANRVVNSIMDSERRRVYEKN